MDGEKGGGKAGSTFCLANQGALAWGVGRPIQNLLVWNEVF